jgi:hypothetical protein
MAEESSEDKIERVTGKRLTREMIQVTDDFLKATVEVTEDSSFEADEEDPDEDEDEKTERQQAEFDKKISKIDDIMKFPKDKLLVDEETKNEMRFSILNSMVDPHSTRRAIMLGDDFKGKIAKILAKEDRDMDQRKEAALAANEKASAAFGSRGGTKRRKSKKKKRTKKTKRTKRKLK